MNQTVLNVVYIMIACFGMWTVYNLMDGLFKSAVQIFERKRLLK